jgi:uncharacterized damage-inducible protein DinB
MTTKDALKGNLDLSQMVLSAYVSDLSDAELLMRPAPSANHLAWQLGHLIAAEHNLLNMVVPNSMPQLPAGFAEQHGKATTGSNDPSKFLTKKQYLDLMAEQRAAAKKVLDAVPDTDLDKPGPDRFRSICPTVGSFLILVGNHGMMHAGQFATVRRTLGKPIVI